MPQTRESRRAAAPAAGSGLAGRSDAGEVNAALADRLAGASCDPRVLAVARSAVAACLDGLTAAEWRTALTEHSRRHLADTAEQCMRESGLWPWNLATPASLPPPSPQPSETP